MLKRPCFYQWTVAVSPGHPLRQKIVVNVVSALQALVQRANTTTSELKPADSELLEVSGPIIWTHAVLESLSEATDSEITYRNVSGIKQPKLLRDILILPVDGFGMGQPHSGISLEGSDPYVRHQWKGLWRNVVDNP